MRSRISSWNETITKLGFKRKKRKVRKSSGFDRKLRGEGLEDRRMMAVVMNTNDSGTGSLRAAILAASPSEIITFDSALNGATIDIQSALAINKSLTIDASSLSKGITVDAGHGADMVEATGDGWRIFTIDDANDSVHKDVTLKAMTLKGGDAFKEGGAILSKESLTLDGMIITNNAAVVDYETTLSFTQILGGGVYSSGPSLTVIDTIIKNNVALADYSGIQGRDNANVVAFGGGVYATSPTQNFTNTVISNNQSIGDVRGLVTPETPVNGYFNASTLGGGLFSSAGLRSLGTVELEMTNCQVNGNSTKILFENSFTDAQDSQIESYGGGFYFGGAELLISGTTLSNNISEVTGTLLAEAQLLDTYAQGGGLYLDGSAEIISSTVSENEARIGLVGGNMYGAYSRGGGIFIGGAEQLIMHSTVANNHVFLESSADNPAIFNGGGLFAQYANVNLDHALFADNFALGEGTPPTPNDVSTISTTVSAIYSLIEDGSITGTGVISGDPQLLPLGDYGGFLLPDGSHILTHALPENSVAVDAGNPEFEEPPFFDQRGDDFERVYNDVRIDIGAFEFGAGSGADCDADFDHDGDVDGRDFLIWQRGFGKTNPQHSDGDADFDGDVDGDDLACWQAHYGSGFSTPISADINGVDGVDEDDLAIILENFGMETGATLGDGDADGDGDVDEADIISWQVDYADAISDPNWIDNALNFDPDNLANGQIIVTNPNDENDNNYGLGDLSLREALALSTKTGGPKADVIVFANYAIASGTLALTGGQLNITSGVEIIGPGADLYEIDPNGNSRVFKVSSGIDVTLSGLTVTRGEAQSDTSYTGGGIFNLGNLTLENMEIVDNNAAEGGGGLYSNAGSVTIIATTFDGNTATHGGGARIGAQSSTQVLISGSTFSNNLAKNVVGGTSGGLMVAGASTAPVEIVNSTFSGNEAYSSGGVRIRTGANVAIVNTTITDNDGVTSAGGLTINDTSTAVVFNSIVAGNTAPSSADVTGSLHGTSSNNLLNTANPGLAPLGNYGGPTQTHAPLIGSSAIDGGNSSIALTTYGLALDQRGKDREVGSLVDIGAFETGNDYSLIVSILADEDDNIKSANDLSLREAIELAGDLSGEGTIMFAESLFSGGAISIVLGDENGDGDAADVGETPTQLTIDNDIRIVGPGANLLTIDAGGMNRIFSTTVGSEFWISNITLANGNASTNGGAIYANDNLVIGMVTFLNNNATNNGGALYSADGELTVYKSTFEENEAGGWGGAIDGSLDYLNITDSTFYLNTAGVNGAAIRLLDDSFGRITNSTFSNNQGGAAIYVTDDASLEIVNNTIAYNSGGIAVAMNGGISVHNSIVAANISGGTTTDFNGTIDSGSSHNLFSQSSISGLNTTSLGNMVGVADPKLSVIGNYGGPTQTHRPLEDSLAVNAGYNEWISATNFDLQFDQRGFERVFDDLVDIGAVELAFDEF
jgi:predicted outer membrane repeat protein